MSETRTLTIESVEEKNGLYIVMAGGKKYGTKEEDIKKFVGKTAEFQVAMVQKGQYKNFYINAPLPELCDTEPVNSAPINSYDQGKRENTLLMCAKDLTVAAIMSAQLDAKDTNILAKHMMDIYSKLIGEVSADSIPF